MQGVHSDYVLLLADEASGIPEEVFNAASGSMSGHQCTTILTGNPTRASGFFFDTHGRLAEYWKTYHVSSFDSPRVSKEFIEEVKTKSGEDSNEYRIRVLGEFPTTDDNTIIPREICEAAQYRDVVLDTLQDEIWGLDVARFGDDRTVLVKRQGQVVTDLQFWRGLDLMQTCGAVKAQYDAAGRKPAVICVDAIGLGGGVVDRLREQNLPVLGVNVSETPVMGNYRNLKAELWFRVKDWLERRSCKLPKNDSLVSELCSVRYTFTSSGKAQVESKEEMKRRGLKSPDLADALVLTFAASEAQMMNPGYKFNRPLKRSLSNIV
jgi:phage terminase large subunit